jgi:hypothetical protein
MIPIISKMLKEEAAKRGGLKNVVCLSITANRDGDLCPNHSDDRDRHAPCGRRHVRDLHEQE